MKTLWIEDKDALNVGRVVVTETGTNNCVICYSCDEIDDYENRLKTDMVAMLTEIQLEIEEESWSLEAYVEDSDTREVDLDDVNRIIQQKIDKLKENTDG